MHRNNASQNTEIVKKGTTMRGKKDIIYALLEYIYIFYELILMQNGHDMLTFNYLALRNFALLYYNGKLSIQSIATYLPAHKE